MKIPIKVSSLMRRLKRMVLKMRALFIMEVFLNTRDHLVYDEFVDADSKIANDASKDHDVKPVNGANGTLGQENNVILNQVDLLPPPPTVKEVQEEVANGSGLSYSQQQATIQLQSPSKRKDNSSQTSTKPNEPRLVIDKLVLTNFKSYAGVQ